MNAVSKIERDEKAPALPAVTEAPKAPPMSPGLAAAKQGYVEAMQAAATAQPALPAVTEAPKALVMSPGLAAAKQGYVEAMQAAAAARPAPVEAAKPALVVAVPVVAPARQKRRLGRFALMALLPLALIAGGTWYYATGGRYQETENANLRQARVTIASEAAGRIVAVGVADNAVVKAGDLLFTVDPEPYRIALAQADAALSAARLSVEQLRAAWSQAVAEQRVADSEVAYYRSELERQASLADKGIATRAVLDSARRDLAKAEEESSASAEAVIGALAKLGGHADIATDKHPAVLSALAERDQAAWQLAQTTIRAPADGIVSQAASFKLGQFVSAGTPLFSLVETGDAWVEANFKETQLTHMKLGQTAEVVLDTYPDRPLTATVESIGAGTGAEFSLLPAQNATGNWVKVTQRIPVRLKVDSDEARLLLRTGMSASVSVDTGKARGLGGLFGMAVAAE